MKINKDDATNSIYFSYGAPFYKCTMPDGSSSTSAQRFGRPIGLLFKGDLIEHANKVYPFDSGAFDKHFRSFFPDNYDLKTFEITPVDLETPGRLVSLLYGDNNKYIYGQPIERDKAKETIVDCLLDLLSIRGCEDFDQRNHSIEVLFYDDVSISDMVELVLFPRTVYKENKALFKGNLNNLKIDYYEDSYRYDPKEDSSVIQSKVKEYLRANNMLNN